MPKISKGSFADRSSNCTLRVLVLAAIFSGLTLKPLVWFAHDGKAFVESTRQIMHFDSELRGGTLIMLRQVYAPKAMEQAVQFAKGLHREGRVWDPTALRDFYRVLSETAVELGVEHTKHSDGMSSSWTGTSWLEFLLCIAGTLKGKTKGKPAKVRSDRLRRFKKAAIQLGDVLGSKAQGFSEYLLVCDAIPGVSFAYGSPHLVRLCSLARLLLTNNGALDMDVKAWVRIHSMKRAFFSKLGIFTLTEAQAFLNTIVEVARSIFHEGAAANFGKMQLYDLSCLACEVESGMGALKKSAGWILRRLPFDVEGQLKLRQCLMGTVTSNPLTRSGQDKGACKYVMRVWQGLDSCRDLKGKSIAASLASSKVPWKLPRVTCAACSLLISAAVAGGGPKRKFCDQVECARKRRRVA